MVPSILLALNFLRYTKSKKEMHKITLLQYVKHDVENRGLHSLYTSKVECYDIISSDMKNCFQMISE